jgi:hypothetical protein
MAIIAVRRGRPRKFSRPARTVTLTLPDDVIERLARIDADLGRAIVRLAQSHEPAAAAATIEVAAFGSRAVILVPPSRRLAALPGVELVPIGDGRALIALDEQVSEQAFELMVRDALDAGALTPTDRDLFQTLAATLREARDETRVDARRILVLHARSSAGRTARRPR